MKSRACNNTAFPTLAKGRSLRKMSPLGQMLHEGGHGVEVGAVWGPPGSGWGTSLLFPSVLSIPFSCLLHFRFCFFYSLIVTLDLQMVLTALIFLQIALRALMQNGCHNNSVYGAYRDTGRQDESRGKESRHLGQKKAVKTFIQCSRSVCRKKTKVRSLKE